MDSCSDNCRDNRLVLCRHRFNFGAKIIYCNGKGYSGWPDSKILAHFFNYIRIGIQEGLLEKTTVFVIVTKDHDFLVDAEKEWKRIREEREEWVFGANYVRCGDIVIFTQQIDCRNYGTRGTHNLKCVIFKMNKFFNKPKSPNPN